MNRRIVPCGVALVVASVLVTSQVISQEKAKSEKKQAKENQKPARDEKPKAKDTPPAINMEEMMKKWMEMAAVGEPHQALDPLVGKWETASRFWMGGPDSPAMDTKGSAEIKQIMDGRFLVQEASGDFMGMPFKGMGITGYDNFKKKYVSFWIDNMGTAMFTSLGTMDPSGKVINFYGQLDEPLTGEQDKMAKMVLRIISNDKHVLEMYDLALGDNAKVGEITYTRKKAEKPSE